MKHKTRSGHTHASFASPSGSATMHDQPPPRPATHKPRMVALVVTFNRLEMLQETVERLESEAIDLLVVVDNGSTDGTQEWLAKKKSDVFHPILSDKNLGGAGGFALGLTHVRDHEDADWVLLTDDDARPEKGALKAFYELDRSACDVVVSAVFYPDGTICDMNRPIRNPFQISWNRRQPYRLSDEDFDKDADQQEVDMATFVGLFLSRRALNAVHGPDPKLFLYGDDLIHTLKLSQAGMRLVFAPEIRFEHDCKTLNGTANTYHPLWKVYYHYRNAILLYRLSAGRLLWPVLALRLPKWWLAARHYGADASEFRRLLRCAISDGLRGRLSDPPSNIPHPPK